jgi:hypothetical protein
MADAHLLLGSSRTQGKPPQSIDETVRKRRTPERTNATDSLFTRHGSFTPKRVPLARTMLSSLTVFKAKYGTFYNDLSEYWNEL